MKKTTEELEKMYGKSAMSTKMFDGEAFLGKEYLFKDGKSRRLIHIEVRNMLVDLWRFDDGTELFTGDIDRYFDKDTFK